MTYLYSNTSGIGIELFSLIYFIVATLLSSHFAVVSGEISWDFRGERKTQSTPSSNERKMAQFMLPLSGCLDESQEHGTFRSCPARWRRADRLNVAYKNTPVFSDIAFAEN